MSDRKRVYTVAEAAALLGVGRSKLFDMIRRRVVRRMKLGYRTTRIPAEEVERVIAAKTRHAKK